MNQRDHDGTITPATPCKNITKTTTNNTPYIYNTYNHDSPYYQSISVTSKKSCTRNVTITFLVFVLAFTNTIVLLDAFTIQKHHQQYILQSNNERILSRKRFDNTIVLTPTLTLPQRRRQTTSTTTTTLQFMIDVMDDIVLNQSLLLSSTIATTTSSATDTTITQQNLLQQLISSYMYSLDHYSIVTQSCTAAFFAGVGDCIAQRSSSSKQSEINAENSAGDKDTTNGVFKVDLDVVSRSTKLKQQTFNTVDTSSYDVQRTMHYIFKGLGGGCMWGIWFDYSDIISYDLTQQLLQSTFVLPMNTEIGYATSISQNIDISTALSYKLALYHLPLVSTLSGSTIQHIIHVLICILLEQFIVSPLFFTVWDIPIPALLSGSPVRQLPAQVQAKLLPLLIANAKVWTPANIITYSLPSEYRVLFASMTDIVWQTILSEITSNEIIISQVPPKEPAQSVGELKSELPQVNPTAMYTEGNSNTISSTMTDSNTASGTTLVDIVEPAIGSVVVTTAAPLFLSTSTTTLHE